MAASTRRAKVTSFIAQKHSRQELEPVVGKLIDRAHVDPLYLKNNAWCDNESIVASINSGHSKAPKVMDLVCFLGSHFHETQLLGKGPPSSGGR